MATSSPAPYWFAVRVARYLKPLPDSLPRYRSFAAPAALGPIKKALDQFDVIHLHDYRTALNISVCRTSREHHVPVVLQAHGGLSKKSGHAFLKDIFDRLFGPGILASITRAIALNEREVELYISAGLDAADIRVVPNAIDLHAISRRRPGTDLTARLEVPIDSHLLLYLGRLHPSKRLDLLVQSFEAVARKVPNAFLVLAGPDDGYGREIRRLVRSLALESRVLLTGFVEEDVKYSLIRRSDAIVIPAFAGFPVTILEAFAVGTPIVTTTLSDSFDWLENGFGLVVEPSIGALADVFFDLFTDPAARDALGTNGQRLVRERFTWEKVTDQYVAVYTDCIEASRRVRS